MNETQRPAEMLAKDGRRGCPVTVWDGPYSTRCGLGASIGRCAYHGQFADLGDRGTFDELGRREADCGCCSIVDNVGLRALIVEMERLTTALAEAERPCRHMELPDTLGHRLNQAEQERDEWRDLARGYQSEKVASAAELADLQAKVEARERLLQDVLARTMERIRHDRDKLRALLAKDGA